MTHDSRVRTSACRQLFAETVRRPTRLSCENDTGVVWRDYSDIYSSGRFDDIVTIHLRKTADYEVRFEVSSGPSHSHRTRREEGAFYDLSCNFEVNLSLYSYSSMLKMSLSVLEERNREENRSDT